MKPYRIHCALSFLLWIVSLLAMAGSIELPRAENLQADAQQAVSEKKPIVLFFTLPNCSYCRIVRYDYFLPLLKQRTGNDQPIIREISVTGQNRVTLFDGQRVSEAELAERLGPDRERDRVLPGADRLALGHQREHHPERKLDRGGGRDGAGAGVRGRDARARLDGSAGDGRARQEIRKQFSG